jgi:hypothetical protein
MTFDGTCERGGGGGANEPPRQVSKGFASPGDGQRVSLSLSPRYPLPACCYCTGCGYGGRVRCWLLVVGCWLLVGVGVGR